MTIIFVFYRSNALLFGDNVNNTLHWMCSLYIDKSLILAQCGPSFQETLLRIFRMISENLSQAWKTRVSGHCTELKER